MRRSLLPPDAGVRNAARWVLGCAVALALGCGADEAPPTDPARAGGEEPGPPAVEMGMEAAPDTQGATVPLPPSAALPAAAPAPVPSPGAQAEEPGAEASATAEAGTRSDAKPLTDLLRLPAVTPVDPATERAADRLKVEPAPAPEKTAEAGSPESRLKVEYESKTDEVELMKRARTRTDAGVSVETGEGTRLKTGVRVEQEQGLERESPVPTVGIEKRF